MGAKTESLSKNLKITLYSLGIIWLVLAIIKTTQASYSLPILLIFFAEAFSAFVTGYFSYSKRIYLQIIIFAYTSMNILLTIFDQMGFYDFLVLAFYLVAFAQNVVLIKRLIQNKRKKKDN